MSILIIVNNVKEWQFHIPGVQVVDAWSYLTRPEYGAMRAVKVFNLCRSYRYQTAGYYVTLLAAARGHKPLPSITTIQDMKSQTMVRFVSDDLDDLIQHALAPIQSEEFTLSVYFGHNLAKRYDRLSLQLFNLFQAPLLRAQFERAAERWQLRNISPIPVGDIPEPHHAFVIQEATGYFAGKRANVRKRVPTKYDLAILHNPQDELAPSDEKALERFIKAAEAMGLGTELVTRDDYARIAEFDALFIRETTQVNHHTYRFARRATTEGLVVIDDPESILKCANKVYMAELMARHKVPMPRTLIVHEDNIDEIGPALGFPVVLKQPDSAFSQGVVQVKDEAELHARVDEFLEKSELVIAQEFLPTTFDWRIGICDGQPLYACKYHMASGHWQIVKNDVVGPKKYGKAETIPVEIAPRHVVRAALKAANLIGNGLYGVDIKQTNGHCYVIEINDNPNIDAGVEDKILKGELYRRIMDMFLRRLERKRAGIDED
ncbi:MAG: ATP-grasp domain-containing protein [Planctomycetaceae bacterium]|nr:ATP-grasp domain-containing protein [Planctomycetaceae bacterium]